MLQYPHVRCRPVSCRMVSVLSELNVFVGHVRGANIWLNYTCDRLVFVNEL